MVQPTLPLLRNQLTFGTLAILMPVAPVIRPGVKNAVQAQSGKKIPEDDANEFIGDAQVIIDLLSPVE